MPPKHLCPTGTRHDFHAPQRRPVKGPEAPGRCGGHERCEADRGQDEAQGARRGPRAAGDTPPRGRWQFQPGTSPPGTREPLAGTPSGVEIAPAQRQQRHPRGATRLGLRLASPGWRSETQEALRPQGSPAEKHPQHSQTIPPNPAEDSGQP